MELLFGNPVVFAGNPVADGGNPVLVAGNLVVFLALKSKTVLEVAVNCGKTRIIIFEIQLGLSSHWCLPLKKIISSFIFGTHCF